MLAVTWRMGFRLDKPDICQEMKEKLKNIRYGDLAKAGFVLQRVAEARPTIRQRPLTEDCGR